MELSQNFCQDPSRFRPNIKVSFIICVNCVAMIFTGRDHLGEVSLGKISLINVNKKVALFNYFYGG